MINLHTNVHMSSFSGSLVIGTKWEDKYKFHAVTKFMVYVQAREKWTQWGGTVIYFIIASRLTDGAHPPSYPMGMVALLLRVKRLEREANNSPPFSTTVTNVRSYTSSPY
jgi:hypothetical protein